MLMGMSSERGKFTLQERRTGEVSWKKMRERMGRRTRQGWLGFDNCRGTCVHTARSRGQPGRGADMDRMAQYSRLCWHVNRQAQTVL